jgi:hypothetical protein
MTAIAYITDVEGRWDKLEGFARDNPYVKLEGGRLVIAQGATLVFGGDAVDRGPDALRVVSALLEARLRQPSQVVLLAGNRDINKLRLARELRGQPPSRAPDAERAAGGPTLLRWILGHTMGAPEAFEHRRAELSRGAREPATDDAVFESFRADMAPGGTLRAYLRVCTLGARIGDALFLHGGVTEDNFGYVPTGELDAECRVARMAKVTDELDPWLAALDDFYREQLARFEAGADALPEREPPGWTALVRYQAPLPGTRLNQQSVVYARPTDAFANPSLPAPALLDRLRRAGVRRLFLGHTPSGDCPAVLRHEDFSLVLADNSYARDERGSQVLIERDRTVTRGVARLEDGSTREVHTAWTADEPPPLGTRERASGRLVKARAADGAYLLFRGMEGFRTELRALDEASIGEVEPAF